MLSLKSITKIVKAQSSSEMNNSMGSVIIEILSYRKKNLLTTFFKCNQILDYSYFGIWNVCTLKWIKFYTIQKSDIVKSSMS